MNIHVHPIHKNLSISLPPVLNNIATVEIRDAKGLLMFRKEIIIDGGEFEIKNIGFSEGTYTIKVVLGDKIFKKSLMF